MSRQPVAPLSSLTIMAIRAAPGDENMSAYRRDGSLSPSLSQRERGRRSALRAIFTVSEVSDDHLVDQARARRPGWESAFDRLVARHRSALLRRCQGRLGNPHDAEDVVQEVMVRAYRGIAGFQGNASFRTWLYTIADNQCATYATRRTRHRIGDGLRNMLALYEETQRPRVAASDELTNRVASTLARLPPSAREVLGLRFFREHSLEEIALIQGVGLSAAKMRLYRAMEQFAHYHGQFHAPAA